jgi:hypothetical protein
MSLKAELDAFRVDFIATFAPEIRVSKVPL